MFCITTNKRINIYVSLFSAQDPIRAVVMSDRVILIVPEGADSLLAILDRYMKEWVCNRA